MNQPAARFAIEHFSSYVITESTPIPPPTRRKQVGLTTAEPTTGGDPDPHGDAGRQFHRAVAEHLEQNESDPARYADLAYHWQAADDIPKAIHYLEKPGDHARELGDFESARRFFNASLELSS